MCNLSYSTGQIINWISDMAGDLTGLKFGRWLTVKLSPEKKYGRQIAYDCVCDCGTKRLLAGYRLTSKQTESCGCAALEASTIKNTKHGLWKHRLHGTWRSMKERCYNPNHDAYHRYGGRGITVCERWHKVEYFISDNDQLALPGTTIDRKDNDLPYSPGNCRWVTRRAQANNRDNNIVLEFRGKTKTVAEWAKELQMFEPTLRKRILQCGWSVEKALTTPVRERAGSPHKPKMLPRDPGL